MTDWYGRIKPHPLTWLFPKGRPRSEGPIRQNDLSGVHTLQVSFFLCPVQPSVPNKPLNSPSHCFSGESTLRHHKCTRSVDMALAISHPAQTSVSTEWKLYECGQNGQGLSKSTLQGISENSYFGRSFTWAGRETVRCFSNKLYLILHQRTLREKTGLGRVCGWSFILMSLFHSL